MVGFEAFFAFFNWLLGLDTGVLLFIIFITLIIAFKVFQYLLKALITGIIFGLIPVSAYLLGWFPLDLKAVLWFILFGILICFVYSVIAGIAKGFNAVFPKGEKTPKQKPEKEKQKEKE